MNNYLESTSTNPDNINGYTSKGVSCDCKYGGEAVALTGNSGTISCNAYIARDFSSERYNFVAGYYNNTKVKYGSTVPGLSTVQNAWPPFTCYVTKKIGFQPAA
jgi:hypothetical protein